MPLFPYRADTSARVLARPPRVNLETSPRVRSIFFRTGALFLSFGNVDSGRDPVCSLFSVGYLQHGTALSGEALNGLFRAGNLSLVVVRECHFRLGAGSFDGDDF